MPKLTQSLALACCAVLSTAAPGGHGLWEQFKAEHNRSYATPAEEQHHRQCFQQNLEANLRQNLHAGGATTFGVTRFADLCPAEFKARHLGLRFQAKRTGYTGPALFNDADVKAAQQEAFDWRTKGAVTPVGDEGQCGSTWAWAAVASMEAQWFLKTGTLIALSKQEIVSCDTAGSDAGCNGGFMDGAYQWVLDNKGIDSEADYPYTSGTGNPGTCRKDKLPMRVAHFANYTDLPKDEFQLLAWMAKNGPITAGVDASQGWQTYTGGIMSTCTGTNLDHAVNLVGYTAPQGSTPAYWIAKNQWSTKWGESGYIRLAYGSNQCGLTLQASSILN